MCTKKIPPPPKKKKINVDENLRKCRKRFSYDFRSLLLHELKNIYTPSFYVQFLTYGCKTWPVTKGYEEKINIFERKLLRRIYGTVKENIEGELTEKCIECLINPLLVRI